MGSPPFRSLFNLEKTKPTPMEHSAPIKDYLLAQPYSDVVYQPGRSQDHDVNAKVRAKLAKDPFMSTEEKEKAMKQFVEEGYYQHTASETADANRKSTELRHDTKKLTYEQCVQKVDVNHLEETKQKLVKDMMKRCKLALATHEWDVPATPHFQLDPVVKDEYRNSIPNTKYIPTAQQNREELDEVISEMTKNGILTQTDKPTPVINNILTTLKASRKK